MEIGRSPGDRSPVIFDGLGRLYLKNGDITVDMNGVRKADEQLFSISRMDFELIEEIGSGQFGNVWSVRHLPSNTIMAMKIVALSVTDTSIKQILTELDILIRAQSPFIVGSHGAFCTDSSIHFCMELMDEGSIDVILQRHRLSPGNQLEDLLKAIAFSVTCGLKFLRDSFSVIHRDVKPSNILISRDGSIKICDFGVSGYLAQSLAKTRIGTSNYMAPERISLGNSENDGAYGVKSDVWSLGASLMEIATGSPPFPLSNYDCIFAQLMDIISSDSPKMPQNGHFSVALVDFIDSCLKKDPKDRPTYSMLLEHPFLENMSIVRSKQIVVDWIST